MDSLANQLSNVSLYDVKAYVRKAQNAVLNFSDIEAKVREATNNEPWGVPTTVMQQIADATNNYQQFHEIMPFVYRRFTEKSANEWRQIYKALQLLDYLVRNGSERVVDYARSHISVVEMLRHFSYIDSKGVDQGASIRKRSEELVNLLNSVERLRAERKKAKQLLAKTGASGLGSSHSSSPYSAASFNSPSLGSSSSGFGGSGSKYGGISSDQYRAMQFRGGAASASLSSIPHTYGDDQVASSIARDDDLEEYEVESVNTASRSKNTNTKKTATEDEDDDFADFQTAPAPSASSAKPTSTTNILDLFDSPVSMGPAVTASPVTGGFTSTPLVSATNNIKITSAAASAAPAKPAMDDLFDSLWQSSKSSIGKPAVAPATTPSQPASSTSTSSAAPIKTGEIEDLLSF